MIHFFTVKSDQLSHMADAESLRITSSFNDQRLPTPELLKLEAADSRLRLIDVVWDAFIHSPAGEELTDTARNALKFDFRDRVPPLAIPCPVPREELRASVMPLSACLGALLGMATLTPLMRLLFGNAYREFGLLLGAPIGALLLVAVIRFLSQHKILLRSLQAVLGLTTIAEVASLFLSPLNPFRLVWRTLTSRFGGKGLWGSIKRICYFIIAILLLQLAVPVKKLALRQLKDNTDTAVHSWLEGSVLLLSLLAASKHEAEQTSIPDKQDQQLLQAVVKLVQANESERPVINNEIIQAFKNAGYDCISPVDCTVYNPGLLAYFTSEGLVENGDPVKILQPPVMKNDTCILKGRLTRKRG
jgi:hypothetical protein